MTFTPKAPVSKARAVNSSLDKLSSTVLAKVACKNASISSLNLLRAFACLLYAAIPFKP